MLPFSYNIRPELDNDFNEVKLLDTKDRIFGNGTIHGQLSTKFGNPHTRNMSTLVHEPMKLSKANGIYSTIL